MTEIREEGTEVVDDVQKAVSKVESGSYITGFAEIGKIIHEFPATLTTCKNMDDDIAAIESWATIFTEPKELAETLSKNWLLHRRTIKADLTKESADWAAGSYFDAGVDTALALTEAVGPITTPTNDAENVDILSVPEFVAGFLYEITGNLHLTEVEACYQGAQDLEPFIQKMIADIR